MPFRVNTKSRSAAGAGPAGLATLQSGPGRIARSARPNGAP